MWPYWFMLLLPASALVAPGRLPTSQARWVLALGGAWLAVMLGLRHEVGGDWFRYEEQFYLVGGMALADVLAEAKDPGYYVLSWLVSAADWNVYVLNLLCATVLVCGTVALARRQPWTWLAIVAAVPYLLLVVGMGYTRQSVAIGFAMLGLVGLERGSTWRFAAWILLAAAFHKTAVLLLPIAALAATRHRMWTVVWVGVVSAIGAWLFVYDSSEALWTNYVVSDYADASQGAAIRVGMNALPALLLLAWRKRLLPDPAGRALWTWMAVLSLACLPLLPVSATAVDRIALYFIPLQLLVFARLPMLVANAQARSVVMAGVVGYYGIVQFVWLNYATHARAWLPYQFVALW